MSLKYLKELTEKLINSNCDRAHPCVDFKNITRDIKESAIIAIKKELEMNRISSIKGEVDELKLWRSRVDDVVSPSQLQNALQEIESLKIFKSKAIAIFATVQFAMGAIIWALRVFA